MGPDSNARLSETLTTLLHELVGQSKSAVRAEDADTCDMSVRDAIGWLFLHFAQYVSNDPPLFILSDVGKLRPSQCMVEIVS